MLSFSLSEGGWEKIKLSWSRFTGVSRDGVTVPQETILFITILFYEARWEEMRSKGKPPFVIPCLCAADENATLNAGREIPI